MIILNFVLFLLIAVGQLVIYQAVMVNSMATGSQRDSTARDATIARRQDIFFYKGKTSKILTAHSISINAISSDSDSKKQSPFAI